MSRMFEKDFAEHQLLQRQSSSREDDKESLWRETGKHWLKTEIRETLEYGAAKQIAYKKIVNMGNFEKLLEKPLSMADNHGADNSFGAIEDKCVPYGDG